MPRPLNPDTGRYDLKARPEQLKRWAVAAEASGQELASWIRSTLDSAARRELKRMTAGIGRRV